MRVDTARYPFSWVRFTLRPGRQGARRGNGQEVDGDGNRLQYRIEYNTFAILEALWISRLRPPDHHHYNRMERFTGRLLCWTSQGFQVLAGTSCFVIESPAERRSSTSVLVDRVLDGSAPGDYGRRVATVYNME